MFFSEFFWPRHNVFQPGGYIFFLFHSLTSHKPLHFNGLCFILSLRISVISWPIGRTPQEGRGVHGGGPPCNSKNTTFKIFKKKATTSLYIVVAMWAQSQLVMKWLKPITKCSFRNILTSLCHMAMLTTAQCMKKIGDFHPLDGPLCHCHSLKDVVRGPYYVGIGYGNMGSGVFKRGVQN